MHLHGWPARLLEEAAEIAETEAWGEVIDGWTTKTWLDEFADNDIPLKDRLDIQHPDGDMYQDQSRWVYGMRPRMSRQEMIDDSRDYLSRLAAAVFDEQTAHPPFSAPSWRRAAAMPTMMKSEIDDYAHTVTVADADNNELVCMLASTTELTPVLTADMDNPASLRNAVLLLDGNARPETSRDWTNAHATVLDGQWRRPDNEAFLPLPHTPKKYPAQQYPDWADTVFAADIHLLAPEEYARKAVEHSDEAEAKQPRHSAAEQKRLAWKAIREDAQNVADEAGVSVRTIRNWQRKHGMR